jgi:hypothetical protein
MLLQCIFQYITYAFSSLEHKKYFSTIIYELPHNRKGNQNLVLFILPIPWMYSVKHFALNKFSSALICPIYSLFFPFLFHILVIPISLCFEEGTYTSVLSCHLIANML